MKSPAIQDVVFVWNEMLYGGFECEAERGPRWYALAVEPLKDCAWDRVVWMIDTVVDCPPDQIRPVAMGLASSIDKAKAEAEEACRRLFGGTIESVK